MMTASFKPASARAALEALKDRFAAGVEIVPPSKGVYAPRRSPVAQALISWLLLALVILMFFSALFALASGDVSPDGIVSQLFQIVSHWNAAPVLLIIAVTLLSLISILIAIIRNREDRRHHYERAFQASRLGNKPYLLFLRSFEADATSVDLSHMELEVVRSVAPWAIVIAIDNTTRSGITSGALRIRTVDAIWREVVHLLAGKAVGVIIDGTSLTTGLAEEVRSASDSGLNPRVLILASLAARNSLKLDGLINESRPETVPAHDSSLTSAFVVLDGELARFVRDQAAGHADIVREFAHTCEEAWQRAQPT